MAHRGHRQRDDNLPSLDLERLLEKASPRPSVTLNPYSEPLGSLTLSELGDQRRFDFNAPEASARSTAGTPARIILGSVSHPPPMGGGSVLRAPAVTSNRWAPEAFRFAQPDNTLVCIRRKSRREVLFAKRKRGRGGSRRRRTPYSDVRC